MRKLILCYWKHSLDPVLKVTAEGIPHTPGLGAGWRIPPTSLLPLETPSVWDHRLTASSRYHPQPLSPAVHESTGTVTQMGRRGDARAGVTPARLSRPGRSPSWRDGGLGLFFWGSQRQSTVQDMVRSEENSFQALHSFQESVCRNMSCDEGPVSHPLCSIHSHLSALLPFPCPESHCGELLQK